MSILARLILGLALLGGAPVLAADPLPSWNAGPNKQAIIDFVTATTREGGPKFVPVAERIAVFDHDGTLWSEQPIYFQFEFAMARIKQGAAQHPQWKTQQPFKAALEDDRKALLSFGNKGLYELMMASHTGMTTEEFHDIVAEWIKTARHPRFNRPYTDLVYQPMLELLAYLRANGFRTFIVSGGGIDFMRVFTQRVYGIPPEQVVGSTAQLKYELRAGGPVLMRLPAVDFVDDGPGKPVGISRHIGRRPVMAFGNSDGDLEMLQYTLSGPGPRFGFVVHHTDAVREWAYDHPSLVGQLLQGLEQAPKWGWRIVDMKKDWKVIYPFEKKTQSD